GAGTGAVLVGGPEQEVVGEKLRAVLEQLRERLLALLGVELVFLLDRYPGKLEPLTLDLLVELRLLGLELGKLVAGGPPFLGRCDFVVSHLFSSLSSAARPSRSLRGSDATRAGTACETCIGEWTSRSATRSSRSASFARRCARSPTHRIRHSREERRRCWRSIRRLSMLYVGSSRATS